MADGLPFSRLCVIGGGLIGTSLARAAKASDAGIETVIADASASVVATIRDKGFADRATTNVLDAVTGADLVVLAVPVGAMGAVGAAIAPSLKDGAVVSDVGSVKNSVLEDLAAVLPDHVHLIPGHPVAGAEKSGPEASRATLFVNRWSILTPPEDADPAAVARLRAFWESIGAMVEIMDAAHHDLVLAVTSHLPHLIAFTIVGTADDLETVHKSEVMKFSAGGFRDFTRIAASDPVMWRDIFLNNREAVIEVLGRFSEELSVLQRAIRWGDGAALEAAFSRTRAIRRGIVEIGQDTDREDFGRDLPAPYSQS
ncbi:MAG: prephenate/arogenate dehydrogenase family protein [Hyphomicrobiaceae bacterium]|nr:prephenate/arogenate dehydrogenase family protein [Hyphomicrobiaceae bacterium]